MTSTACASVDRIMQVDYPCQAICECYCPGACTQSALSSITARDTSHLVGMMESSNSSCHGRAGCSQLRVHQLEVCQHPHPLQQHTQAALIQKRCFSCSKQTSWARHNNHDEALLQHRQAALIQKSGFSCNKQTSWARLNDHDRVQAVDPTAVCTGCPDPTEVLLLQQAKKLG